MRRRMMWSALLLFSGCVWQSWPYHRDTVPLGRPFAVYFDVGWSNADPPGGAHVCASLPPTWIVDVRPESAPYIYEVDVSEVVPSPGAPPAGTEWRCYFGAVPSPDTYPEKVWITPDTLGTRDIVWTLTHSAGAFGTSDVAQTRVTVRDAVPDEDGDGVDAIVAGGTDCDDGDPGAFPGSEELCDGVDQDCDGVADNGVPDQDGDGLCDAHDFGVPIPTLFSGTDTFVDLERGPPGATLTLLVATERGPTPTCAPAFSLPSGAPLCTDLRHLVFRRTVTSASGAHVFRVGAPAGVVGQRVYMQAAWTLGAMADVSPVYEVVMAQWPP